MRFFDRLHPLAAFVYFISVILIAMFTMNPYLVSVCFLSGIIFYKILAGWRKLLISLGYSFPVMFFIALSNPLFVHKGETVLFFLNGKAITKEAVIYGVYSAVMIMAVIYWFKCYSEIMTDDKFIYLFGRILPKLSLLLSMTLAAIPKIKRKYREIEQAQKALTIYSSSSLTDKIKCKFRVISVLISWTLEGSVETADSMRARGYGIPGRTSYHIFHFTPSDALFFALTIVLSATVITFISLGYTEFSFYPSLGTFDTSAPAYAAYAALTSLTGLSILYEAKENILWHYLRSKI